MNKFILATSIGFLLSSTAAVATGYPNPNNPNLQTGGNGDGNNGCGNGNSGNSGTGCGSDGGSGNGGAGGAGGSATIGDLTANLSNSVGPISNALQNTNTLASTATGGSGGSVSGSGNSANSNTNSLSSTASGGAGGHVGIGDGALASTSHANGGAGGAGGAGGIVSLGEGALTSSNVNTAAGGSASIAEGAVQNANRVESSGNAAASADFSGNSHTMVSVTGGNTVVRHRAIPVATAYAPPVSSGIDTCSGGFSAGAQTKVFGVSLGGTKRDRTCEVIKLSRELDNQGYGYEACQILVNEDPRVARAFQATSRTCMATISFEDAAPLIPPASMPAGALLPGYRAGERG